LVVKPVDRDRGEGVTVNINDINQLNDSIQTALKLSKVALIEKQVPGICHRILVANGKVQIAAKRLPKSVKGDGEKTVRQLVELANKIENVKPPWSRLKPFPLDDIALQNLASKNLNPDSIPMMDEFVPLRPIQTSEWGGVIEVCTDSIHPENSEMAIKAAALFGLSIAGIDVISSDITKPWFENGAIINEVNFSPLLAGTPSDNIVSAVLKEIFPNNGTIPIEVFIGYETALHKAKEIQSDFAKKGKKYWLTTDKLTISHEGNEIKFLFNNLFMRCNALLLDKQVEGLLVVIQNDELLTSGLPFQHIDRVHDVIASDINLSGSIDQQNSRQWRQKINSLLNEYVQKK
jgi:cyanophycin synthetase